MAFDDRPMIDPYSINSEASERVTKQYLNQANGFICRNDIPDKGCDLDVELIIDGAKSSNWRFPIQLKSVLTLQLVQNGQYISYSFKTSRLAYLMSRIPASGLIILFNVEDGLCYFDYADTIYKRLLEERETEDWKSKDQVNILIPVQNILDNLSARSIHQTFNKRFEQAAIMHQSFGQKYNLPGIAAMNHVEFDLNNPVDIKRFLVKYGVFMLDQQDMAKIFNLIVHIPNIEVCSDKDLLFIASVVYSEVGKYIDSDFYINKLRLKGWLADDIKEVISFIHLKNQIAIGSIEQEDFLVELKKIRGSVNTAQNRINFEINILFYEILKVKPFEKIPGELIKSINTIFNDVDACKCEEKVKWIMRIWNIENYAILINNIYNRQLTDFRIKESFGYQMNIEERKGNVFFLLSLQQQLFRMIDRADKYAKENDHPLLQAYILSLVVRFFITKELDDISFGMKLLHDTNHKEIFKTRVANSLTACDLFIQKNYLKDAYSSLCNALELIELARIAYDYNFDFPFNKIRSTKEALEKELDLTPYNLVVPAQIEKLNTMKMNQAGDNCFLVGLNDEQIGYLANLALNSYNLPPQRLINIVNEMKAYQLFYGRCKDPKIEILQKWDFERTDENIYETPIKFVLRSKQTGIETAASTDVDALLNSWGLY
jgi:hypothetical protein